jgi:hypothetical protein
MVAHAGALPMSGTARMDKAVVLGRSGDDVLRCAVRRGCRCIHHNCTGTQDDVYGDQDDAEADEVEEVEAEEEEEVVGAEGKGRRRVLHGAERRQGRRVRSPGEVGLGWSRRQVAGFAPACVCTEPQIGYERRTIPSMIHNNF